jgi:transcriptional regulator with XRE-family HTH domain
MFTAEEVKSETGGDLRARRLAAGLSQQRLAELAGCSISFLGLLERGMTPKRSDVLPRIEKALVTATERKGGEPKSPVAA